MLKDLFLYVLYEKIPNLNKIDTYMDQTHVDFEKIIKQVPNIVSVIASNDRLVPLKFK